jgi:urease accessory protein
MVRDGGPTIFAVVKEGKGVDDIVGLLLSAWKGSGAYEVSLERWKEKGRKGSLDA